eukprot:6184356-Pleurochrysis_carterae.AAC.2
MCDGILAHVVPTGSERDEWRCGKFVSSASRNFLHLSMRNINRKQGCGTNLQGNWQGLPNFSEHSPKEDFSVHKKPSDFIDTNVHDLA